VKVVHLSLPVVIAAKSRKAQLMHHFGKLGVVRCGPADGIVSPSVSHYTFCVIYFIQIDPLYFALQFAKMDGSRRRVHEKSCFVGARELAGHFIGSAKQKGQVDFYHNCFKIFGRSEKRGNSVESRSVVARAAYRAREKIHDHRTGLWYDYTKKRGVLHTEILLPEHAPRNFADRAIPWNAVEYAEKQKNAQTARETELSLPHQLPRQVQLDIAREYARYFVDQGMCADLCFHRKGKKNYHVHIMLTMRPLNEDGTWGQKTRKEYLLNSRGQRIKNSKGKWKSRNISLTGWDDEGNVEVWREM
jgi:hypothetical protein